MKTRKLGELEVSEIGLGCMALKDDLDSLKVLWRAVALGITFFDTADVYGNEELLGQTLKALRLRSKVQIATKFGIREGKKDGSPAYVKQACEASLKSLQTDYIDLYYLHRVDPYTPITETVGAMAQLVKEGKVRHLGLSGVTPYEILNAMAVHPIAAVQNEFSLWNQDALHHDIVRCCGEQGVGFVAYSPMGRGFAAQHFGTFEDFPLDDKRRHNSDYTSESGFAYRLGLSHGLKEAAQITNWSPSQLALAWVLAQGEHVVPIPGTRSVSHLEELIEATTI